MDAAQPSGDHEPADVHRRLAAGSDLHSATDFYAQLHNAHRVELAPVRDRDFGFRMRSVADRRFSLRSSTVTGQRWGRIEPVGRYLVTWAQHGNAVMDAGTPDEHVLVPGVPATYPVGRPFTIEAAAGVVMHAVDVEAAYLEQLHVARGGSPGALTLTRRPDPVALARLQERLAVAAPELLEPATPGPRRSTLVGSISRLLLDAFALEEPGRNVHQPRAVGRARDFIVDHCAEPLSVHDIAAAAQLSERGLQQAFTRAGLSSPMVELRNARLQQVRVALREGEPSTTSVAEVARAWSFGHLGRFAGYYAEQFGERPSDTLRG
ncbi:helix-turn-helix domain-containing protein [Curtobacterium caseinilyticum]|uniref:Helix-turn-helix domain-containing protein n=1 Tax=Curtobacterium caseinilyticum TaxID=3055137 RepID=A0ABT7TTA2_9MICO|nr:helix-turn-helix domain-containing protein [Curtobacterium caseinilyticum]MDM7892843.1 helix-turn-helix domain-containing protein [Curtobacterium caseinilyticum]